MFAGKKQIWGRKIGLHRHSRAHQQIIASSGKNDQILFKNAMFPIVPHIQKGWLPNAKLKPTFTFLVRDFAIFNTFTWQNPYQEK